MSPPDDDDVVVVIGSGPCGAIAAAQLVSRGVRVLMIDAGDHAPRGIVVKAFGNTVFRWVSNAEMSTDRHSSKPGTDVEWYSSLSLGGLSNYWTAAVPRFAPADFEDGARIDERYRWPLCYDDLVPYYELAETMLAVTGGTDPTPGVPQNLRRYIHRPPPDWQALLAAANEAGHTVGVLPMAKGRPWMIARRGTEFGSYHCVVAPLLDRRGFQLRRGARAVRLGWSPSAGRVDSVQYLDTATGERRTVRGRAVVVAAGAIDTTALLLQSTSADFPAGLGNTNGLVGRYLHDHPREWWVAHSNRAMSALAHPIYIARAPYEASSPLMATSLTLGLARPSQRLKTFYRGRVDSVGVQVFGTMIPSPDRGIGLSGDGDGDNVVGRPPTISLRYDEATLTNLAAARSRLRDVFHDAGLELDICGPFHAVSPGSSVHYGGTARMHGSPEFGVVDGMNRIHDAPNVVVGDASCFTTGPEKNPTLTAMAIAARAADKLADDLLGGSLR